MEGTQFCFIATGRSGIGHLRRVSTIAQQLRRFDGAAKITLVSNATPSGLERSDLDAYSGIVVCERSDMAAFLEKAGNVIAVLDTVVVPGIERCGCRRVLILRETPDEKTHQFVLPGNHRWDLVIVPNPESHWLPPWSGRIAEKIAAVGWIYRSAGVRNRLDRRFKGVLVATGGGGAATKAPETYHLIDQLLRNVRLATQATFPVHQAIGPRARGLGRLGQAEKFVDPGGMLDRMFREADIVVSTAGYNSVLELATTDTPVLIVPIPRSFDDQRARARLWGPRLGIGYDQQDATSAVDWLVDQLEHPRRRTPFDLGPSGESEAARLILDVA